MSAHTTRTRSISGVHAAHSMLVRGLHVGSPIIRGARESDIATMRIGRRRSFTIKHPDYVDHVLRDAVDYYEKSIEYEPLRAVLGLNLVTDEGESWRRHRTMLNPVMAKRHAACVT